jgi:pimeloyl-ACP methyl ester carboxylesterase
LTVQQASLRLLKFPTGVAKRGGVLTDVETVTFPAAGHIPHITHPDGHTEAIAAFIRRNRADR